MHIIENLEIREAYTDKFIVAKANALIVQDIHLIMLK